MSRIGNILLALCLITISFGPDTASAQLNIFNKLTYGISVGPGFSYRPVLTNQGWPTGMGANASLRYPVWRGDKFLSISTALKLSRYSFGVADNLEKSVNIFFGEELSTLSVNSIILNLSTRISPLRSNRRVYITGGIGYYSWNQKISIITPRLSSITPPISDADITNKRSYSVGGSTIIETDYNFDISVGGSYHIMSKDKDIEEALRYFSTAIGILF